ncbi:lonely Cys domain-containing protein [Streptomyces sp. NPDC058001]|uniref:lonely Cys domain-containing protein n=1 Tax=Streptomyces sp. NPDC058001 TaxID=3346300 RepID=UPI0036E3827A
MDSNSRRRPRNNGSDWVEQHAAALLPLLRRLYGPGRPSNLGSDDVYDDGYSLARHEWAHAIESVLSAEDRQLIVDVYEAKAAAKPPAQWPDGPVPNHSSSNAHEYFAQLSNAYLGANTGKDSNSRRRPRNNGSDWVEQHDPALLPLLRRLYGPGRPSNLGSRDNPYILTGFRQLWDRAEGELTGHDSTPTSNDNVMPTPTRGVEVSDTVQQGGSDVDTELETLLAPPPTHGDRRVVAALRQMFGSDIERRSDYAALYDAFRVLESAHAADYRAAGQSLVLDDVARRVLRLTSNEAILPDHFRVLLQTVHSAARRDWAGSMGALAVYPVVRNTGALSHHTELRGPLDQYTGRNFTGRGGLVMDVSTVWTPMQGGTGNTSPLPAPWRPRPHVVVAELDEASGKIVMDDGIENRALLRDDELAALIGHDPIRPPHAEVLLLVVTPSGAADALPRLVADHARTRVWATYALFSLSGSGTGPRRISLPTSMQEPGNREPVGAFFPSDPGLGARDAGLQGSDGAEFRESDVHSYPLTTVDGQRLTGRAFLNADDMAQLEWGLREVSAVRHYIDRYEGAPGTHLQTRESGLLVLPRELANSYVAVWHGQYGRMVVPRRSTGSNQPMQASQTVRMLRRRPSLQRMPADHPVWIVGCETLRQREGRDPVEFPNSGEVYATGLQRTLFGTDAQVTAEGSWGESPAQLVKFDDPDRPVYRFQKFEPAPQSDVLRDLADLAGLPGDVARRTTRVMRWVRAMRLVFGDIDTDLSRQFEFRSLIRDFGALEMRRLEMSDPLFDSGPLTWHTLTQIGTEFARHMGYDPTMTPDLLHALLRAARERTLRLLVPVSQATLPTTSNYDGDEWVNRPPASGSGSRWLRADIVDDETVLSAVTPSDGSQESPDVLFAPPARSAETELLSQVPERTPAAQQSVPARQAAEPAPATELRPMPVRELPSTEEQRPAAVETQAPSTGQPPLSQEEQLAERGLTPVYVLPGGDVLAHALTAVAPAESGRLAGYSRPAGPDELRAALANALAADQGLPPDEQRLWSAVSGRTGPAGAPLVTAFGGSADEAVRALRTGSGPEATDWLTLAVAAPVLGLRLTVLTPDGSPWTAGPESGRPVALFQQEDPAPYTARWAATEPTVQARQARRPDLSQPTVSSGYNWGTTSADTTTPPGTTTPPAATASSSARPAVFFGSEPRPSTPDSQRAGTSSSGTPATRTPPVPVAETRPVSAPVVETAVTPSPPQETTTPPTARDTSDEQDSDAVTNLDVPADDGMDVAPARQVFGDGGAAGPLPKQAGAGSDGVPSVTQLDDAIRSDESRDRPSLEPTDVPLAPPTGEGRPAPESVRTPAVTDAGPASPAVLSSSAAPKSTETPTAAPCQGEQPPATPDRTPWYMAYDATGQFVVADTTRDVPFSAKLAQLWAGRITQRLHLPDPGPGSSTDRLRAGIREAIRDMLAETKPTKWDDILAVGRTLVVDGRLVWLRPMMHGLEPAPPSGGDVKEYQVGFSSTHAGGEETSENIHGIDTLLFTALNATGSAVATAFGVAAPQIQVRSAKARHHAWSRTILAGRKPFINSFTTFTSGLDLRVYVNGEEATHPDSRVTVPRNLHVKLPEPYTAEHGPRPDPYGPDSVRPQQPGKDGPSQARETLNAVNMTPVIAGLHRNLLDAGIPAPSVRDIMGQLGMDSRRGFLSELTARNRYAWWSSEDSSGRIEASGSLMSSKFRGHVRLTSGIDSLQYVGDTEFGTRDDIGAGTNWTSSAKGSTTGGLGAGYNTAGTGDVGTDPSEDTAPDHSGEPDKGEKFTIRGLVPAATGLFSSDRKIGHSLGVEHLSHTVLNTSGPQSRYRAGLRLVATVTSSTHTVRPVDVITNGELSVVQREASAFVSRTVGPEWTADLRPQAAPSGRRHRVFTPPGRRSTRSAATSRPPFRLGVETSSRDLLQSPGPREPLAMAARRGFGFGVPIAFAGAEKLQGDIREAIERHHAKAVGDRKVHRSDWAGADRDLATFYGRAALEADPYQALLGIHRKIEVGGRVYKVSAKMQWGNRVEGPNELTGPVDRERIPSDNSYEMRVNARAVGGSTVTGERSRKAAGRFAFGAGAVLSIPEREYDLGALHLRFPRARLQLGAMRGFFKGGWGRAFQLKGAAKQYRRTETDGKVDEHRYSMTVRWTVTPERGKSSYIAGRLRAVARVVNPQEHAPAEPVTLRQAGESGRVHASLTRPPTGRSLDFSSGTHGLYPSFHMLPELALLAARMYARQHNLSEDWLRDPSGWPEEVRDLAHPVVLSSRFDDMTGQFGEEIELPKEGDHKQALRIKLHTHAARDLDVSRAVEVEHYLKGSATHVAGKDWQWGLGLDGVFGPQFRYGTEGQQGEDHGPGGRVNFLGHAEGGFIEARGASHARGMIGITRASYGGAVHTLRTTPVFEVTYVRWHGKRLTETTEYLSSVDALDLLVPERRLRDVLPAESPAAATEILRPGPDTTALASTPDGESRHEQEQDQEQQPDQRAIAAPARRTYLSADLIAGIAHPEVLRADGVMNEITARLRRQGVITTEKGSGSESRPNQLLRTLHKSFSSSALQADTPGLMTNQGVSRWIPITGPLGSSRYLWVKVTATRLGAGPTRPRDDVKLTLRGELDDEEAQKRISGWETGFGFDFRARAGGNGVHAGPEGGATYSSSATTVREEANKRVPIYRANPGDASWEFEHDITFRVETGLSTELPEILTAPARLPAGITRLATGNPATDLSLFHWYDAGDGNVGSSALVEGSSIRLLVPQHMTVMTDQPAQDIDLVTPRETEVIWQPPPAGQPKQVVSPAPRQEWPDALLDELHPWTTPAAASIARWAAATAIRQRTPLTVDGAPPEVPGLHSTTRAGLRYDHYTGGNMLRPNIRSLLKHEYEVPVGNQRVLVGFDLDSAEILGPPEGTSFKQRTYVQEDEEPKHETERSSGWKFILGPEVGGESGEDTIIGRAPVVIKEWLDGRSRSSALGDTDERNREGRRSYRHYRFDVTAVVKGPYGTVRMKVPGGFYGMLPVDKATGRLAGGLEEVPELNGLLTPPPATPEAMPPPVPPMRSIPEVVVVPPSPQGPGPDSTEPTVQVADLDETHRRWTAQQLTDEDLPVDRSGLGIPDPEGIYDADDPVDQVRHLMLDGGRWPQAIHAVAARTTLRIWRETFERYADTVLNADPAADRSDIQRHWDEALGLITRGERESVLADPRYAGDQFRDAVRQVAALLLAGGTRSAAAEHAERLRDELGLRPPENGAITDTAGGPLFAGRDPADALHHWVESRLAAPDAERHVPRLAGDGWAGARATLTVTELRDVGVTLKGEQRTYAELAGGLPPGDVELSLAQRYRLLRQWGDGAAVTEVAAGLVAAVLGMHITITSLDGTEGHFAPGPADEQTEPLP